jgi:hypothetical protein
MARAAFIALLLLPRPVWACATCVASAYGDRTFNWAFLGLLLMPFVVGSGIVVVLVSCYYAAQRHVRVRISRGALAAPQLAPHEESSL